MEEKQTKYKLLAYVFFGALVFVISMYPSIPDSISDNVSWHYYGEMLAFAVYRSAVIAVTGTFTLRYIVQAVSRHRSGEMTKRDLKLACMVVCFAFVTLLGYAFAQRVIQWWE